MEHEPEVGNIYAAKGGQDTKFWLLISIKRPRSKSIISSGTACLLGYDENKNIVSAQSYGLHALKYREVIAKVNVENIRFKKE